MADEPVFSHPARTYDDRDGIAVLWEPRLCIHSGRCVQAFPDVFKPKEKPWVQPENAPSNDALADAVHRCPTGALRYERTDGGEAEAAQMPEPPFAVPYKDGPLLVRGVVEVRGPDGAVQRRVERVALCRCGASENKPYCDGSHRKTGFKADGITGVPKDA